jgi:phosphoribosyl-ATP pyrophosphohydrolase/phosphoribosyl-AMP cyclohydrolase/histidinol dehydrogenase
MSYSAKLRVVSPSDVTAMRFDPVDPKAREQAAVILQKVKEGGVPALIEQAVQFGDIATKDAQYLYSKEDLAKAFASLDAEAQGVLTRTAHRIRTFADAQRQALVDVTIPIPGGEAGHSVAPVQTAGCYAPGGRYPLPSSVLMTAITARAAGVRNVYVASPRPALATLAAAHVAGADGLLAIGGAMAIGALAYGVSVPVRLLVSR